MNQQHNYPTRDEVIAQCDIDVFQLAQEAVNLAANVLIAGPTWIQAAYILYHYADWRKMDLPPLAMQTLEMIEETESKKLRGEG